VRTLTSKLQKMTTTHTQPGPRLIAWEVTRSCPLACKHCRAAARHTPYPGELTTDEGRRLLDNIASFSRPTMILTGGEPMLRTDIYDLAGYAHRLGLPVVMAPCGLLITEESVRKMAAAGIQAISISLDGATATSHDAFRGVPGAFEGALRGLRIAQQGGMKFQINTTVTRHNLAELPAILDLAVRLGAAVFNPFLLVPTGRGREMADQEISPADYERTLHWLADQTTRDDIKIRVTCAPHYSRIMAQRGAASRAPGVSPGVSPPAHGALPPGCPHTALPAHGHMPGAHAGAGAKGCLGGKEFAFISHVGKVQICGFLELECGDLKRENLNFRKIWETSELLLKMRDVDAYHGKCGLCEYRQLCGGCRARAYAMTGDALGEEPFCVYQPPASHK
jgi:AdoMet-dependent heme synthase